MKISSVGSQYLSSLKNALGLLTMKKAMNRDAQSVSNLLNSMQNVSSNELAKSVQPHRGSIIDVKV